MATATLTFRARIIRPGRCAAGCSAAWRASPSRKSRSRSTIRTPAPSSCCCRPPSWSCLEHDGARVWDTLAIAEYLAELFPAAGLLPADRIPARCAVRSRAKCIPGFANLRSALPMNLRARYPASRSGPAPSRHRRRVTAIWRECLRPLRRPLPVRRADHGDAMYARSAPASRPTTSRSTRFAQPMCGHSRLAGARRVDHRRQSRARGARRARRRVLSRRPVAPSPRLHPRGAVARSLRLLAGAAIPSRVLSRPLGHPAVTNRLPSSGASMAAIAGHSWEPAARGRCHGRPRQAAVRRRQAARPAPRRHGREQEARRPSS